MGIAGGTIGYVSLTGSDANGGLFYPLQPGAGTNYALQDAPQLTLADVVTNGTTTVTSVIGGFTAQMIANGINIAGIPYMIATFGNTNTITVDRVIGAAVGQTGNVGGAWRTPGFASGVLVTACNCYVKANGTYTLSTTTPNVSGGRVLSPGGTAAFPFFWEGYLVTPGDKAGRPIFDDGGLGGAGIALFQTSATFTIFDGLETIGTNANNTGIAIVHSSSRAIRCKSSGVIIGYDCSGASGSSFIFCEGGNTTNTPFSIRSANILLYGCVAHDSLGSGFTITNDYVRVERCIAFNNAVHGFSGGAGNSVTFIHDTAYLNGGSGFAVSSSSTVPSTAAINCLSVSNGAYGFSAASASDCFTLLACAGYNNTSGNTHFLSRLEGFVTLTANPFTAAPTNFGPNSTAGGGAAVKSAGVPGVFPGLAATISYPDIGAVQSFRSAPTPSGVGANYRYESPFQPIFTPFY